jgi:hypothetical protein
VLTRGPHGFLFAGAGRSMGRNSAPNIYSGVRPTRSTHTLAFMRVGVEYGETVCTKSKGALSRSRDTPYLS